MSRKSDNRRNRPPQYETKFKTLILNYLRKNQSVSIIELEKKIKDVDGIHVNRQTLRNNLRALGRSNEIKFYVKLNPTIKTSKLPEDEEVFIELPVPAVTDGHPKLLLKLINELSNSNKEIVNKSSAELIQLFINRVKKNLSIDAYLYEEKLQRYKKYLKNDHKYTKKDIKEHLRIYESKNKKENYESVLQNAEIEAKKLVDFLIHDANEEFKKTVANQLSTPDKNGKYDLNFKYKI